MNRLALRESRCPCHDRGFDVFCNSFGNSKGLRKHFKPADFPVLTRKKKTRWRSPFGHSLNTAFFAKTLPSKVPAKQFNRRNDSNSTQVRALEANRWLYQLDLGTLDIHKVRKIKDKRGLKQSFKFSCSCVASQKLKTRIILLNVYSQYLDVFSTYTFS